MKHRIKINLIRVSIIIIIFTFMVLPGCHDATFPGQNSDGLATLQGMYVPVEYTKVYFSFTSGEQVDESYSGTTEWDIMFQGSYITANSGTTASTEYGEGSLGSGGWYYTGKSGKDALFGLTVDDVPDASEFGVDYQAYISAMGSPTLENANDMMILASVGSGTSDDPYAYSLANIYDTSDDTAIFLIDGMPPDYVTTERIYIIRCADGTHYAAIMFNDLSQGFGGECEYYVSFYYNYLGSTGSTE